MNTVDEEQELELLKEMLRTKKAHGSIYPARLKELNALEIYELAKADESLFNITPPPPLEIHTATHDTAIIADLLQSMSSYPRIRDIVFPTSNSSPMNFLLSNDQRTEDTLNRDQEANITHCISENVGS